MALVLGTNCGFVTTAPTADPAGGGARNIDNDAAVIRSTSPANAGKITEIGWWKNTDSEESNFEVGLYDTDGDSGVAGTLLEVSRTNAKGTGTGWVAASVDWTITANKIYWIGLQVDNTATSLQIDTQASGGSGYDALGAGQTTLPNPFGGGTFLTDSNGMIAIYAVVEVSAPSGTNTQINIGDSWK